MSKIKFLGYEIVATSTVAVSVRITKQTHIGESFQSFKYTGKSGLLYSLESDLYPAWWASSTYGASTSVDRYYKFFLRGRQKHRDNDVVDIPIKHWPDVRDMIDLYNGFALPPELFEWEG